MTIDDKRHPEAMSKTIRRHPEAIAKDLLPWGESGKKIKAISCELLAVSCELKAEADDFH